MRKSELRKLGIEHFKLFNAKILFHFLKEECVKELGEDSIISFHFFATFLAEKGWILKNFSEESLNSLESSDKNFYQFIMGTPEEKLRHDSWLRDLPQGVMDFTFSYLDVKNSISLSRCSSFFNIHAKNYFIWKDHLEAIGLKPVLGKIHLSAITDYQKLYRTLVKIPYEDRIKLCSWEVYCLSGELYALEYAFEQEKITNQTANRWGTNALHHVARSGSKEAVEYIIETLNIDLRSTDNKNANALYYAAKGGSIELMQFLRNEQGLEPSLTTTGINLLHCAALSGSSEAMEYVQETFKIPPKSTNNYGANAFHFAAKSGSPKAMEYAINTLGIEKTSTVSSGVNALHNASWSGSIEAMMYALSFGIDSGSTDAGGNNALHYAARGGSKKAMAYAIRELGIDATSRNTNNIDALHYAALCGSVEAMEYMIDIVEINPNSVWL
ncbi:ankyrin repeat domain-containing F-box protein [Coxiella burnetii]|uniref:ankyrin repeat domain-containing F-box protein n=1 Tax=Coxiella burnetii TaxID=777 RepID=UPI0000ED001A|nr:ankyrin repeat domain-containing F-box protein [Coxiella burnetii]UYK70039.1 ankyrin repeat domain-containing protein [Coxiella burnetii]